MGAGRPEARAVSRDAHSRVPEVTLCVVAYGGDAYYTAAHEAVASALAHTDAPIVLVTDAAARGLPEDSRITHVPVLQPEGHARRFMTKLEAWRIGLGWARTDVLVLLDADAVFADGVRSSELAGLVASHPLAMVEQTRLPALGWEKPDYRSHYCQTTLEAIDPGAAPPPSNAFGSSTPASWSAGDCFSRSSWIGAARPLLESTSNAPPKGG